MYDLIVVGGGSGGLALSKRAACLYGKKVLIIDKTVLGGTCVNNGCIPKKMLYNAAHIRREAAILSAGSEVQFNWSEFKKKRQTYISFLNSLYDKRNEKDGVAKVTGTGTVHKDAVEVNGTEYRGTYIVLGMGSYPKTINCMGKEHLLSSDDFFKFEKVPKSVAIIGTGYISIETAFVLAEFNCQVMLIARKTGVLRSFDTLIQQKVLKSLKSKGIRLVEEVTVKSLEKKAEEIVLTLVHKDSLKEELISIEKVICAVGRAATTEAISNTDIKTNKNGFIETDSAFKTTADKIYAIGDITMEKHMLTPVAIFSGRRLADYLYSKSTANIKKLIRSVPTVLFSHPPAGSVGCTEKEAGNLNTSVSVHVMEITHPSSLFTTEKNFYKFIYDSETKELYGVHAHGYECDEIIQGYSALVRNNIKYSEIMSYMYSIGSTSTDFLSGTFE